MGKLAVETSQKLVKNGNYTITKDSTIYDAWQQPNEVLILAYMEKDMINVRANTKFQIDA